MPLEPIASQEGPFGDAQRFQVAAATTHEKASGLLGRYVRSVFVSRSIAPACARGTHSVSRVLSRKLKTVPARAGAFRYE